MLNYTLPSSIPPEPRLFNISVFENYCITASDLNLMTPYFWINMLQCLVGWISLPVIVYMIFSRKLHFFDEVHVIIYFKVFLLLLFAVQTVSVNLVQLHDRLMYPENSCMWVRYSDVCTPFKTVYYTVAASFSVTMFFIAVDTILSIRMDNYDSKRSTYQPLLCSFPIIFFLVTFALFWYLDSRAHSIHIHCLEDSINTMILGSFLSVTTIVCDLLTIIISIATYYIGRNQTLSLNRHFRLRSSLMVLKTMFPLIVFHTVNLIVFQLGTELLRHFQNDIDFVIWKTLQGVSNILPYYTLACPILMMVTMKRLKKRRSKQFDSVMNPTVDGKKVDDSVIYFMSLGKQWDDR